MMLGLTEPTSGSVEICGIDSTRHPIEVKRKIGYLPEDVGFYDDMTGPENLIYTARLNGISDAEAKVKALELMEHVGLAGQMKRRPGNIRAVCASDWDWRTCLSKSGNYNPG